MYNVNMIIKGGICKFSFGPSFLNAELEHGFKWQH